MEIESVFIVVSADSSRDNYEVMRKIYLDRTEAEADAEAIGGKVIELGLR